MTGSYDATYAAWRADPEGFWREAATGIDWDRPPEPHLRAALGVYGRWFPGARLNTCHNAVDRHVAAGRGDQAAIIHDSPVTGRVATITYAALLSASRSWPGRWPRSASPPATGW